MNEQQRIDACFARARTSFRKSVVGLENAKDELLATGLDFERAIKEIDIMIADLEMADVMLAAHR